MIRLIRLLQIGFILLCYGLDEWLWFFPFFRPLRFLSYLNPYYWWANRAVPRARRLRLALERLGPIFVKFGQSLSTRRDFLAEDIAEELAKLQDQVSAFPGEQARRLIEHSLGVDIATVFVGFDTNPLASASIAQVHTATLKTGEAVVIKILRPGVGRRIARDIDLLYQLARLIEHYWPSVRQLRPREVVAEFERCLLDELDLMREAANASQLRRNFLHSDLLYIPKIYWTFTRSDVLVMERIYGIPVTDIVTLKKHHIDLQLLAERGVEIFFTQVFRDCFFHADMHPGNIFVSLKNTAPPQYLGVDFGIMGALSPIDQRYLAENLLAFFNRDYRRVVELHVESGWVPEDVRVDEFEAAIRTVCEPVFERPLREISFGWLLLRLFQTARRFNMVVQPQLILLQKTLFNVEGLGRQLYPDLDLWRTAKPFLERWIKRQLGIRALLSKVRRYAPYWAERLPEIPDLIYYTLSELHTRKKTQLTSDYSADCVTYLEYTVILLGLGLSLVLGVCVMIANYFPTFVLKPSWRLWGLGVCGILFVFVAKRRQRLKSRM